jgi:hypothetical protein
LQVYHAPEGCVKGRISDKNCPDLGQRARNACGLTKNATNDVGQKGRFTDIYLLKIYELFVKISIGGSTREAQEASRIREFNPSPQE